ncbi:hypothetical protein [Paenibacillus agricola]|uniref:Uncharacterized protein n=1 Tax=Paenibacillus agricola TaxID=2716264 RepID=A0ABX0JB35_9BACL|nr:hypothetical protein [Paenibacillus agricola]NHN33347.1 hypothetical protein [Paenibacillus agricola]
MPPLSLQQHSELSPVHARMKEGRLLRIKAKPLSSLQQHSELSPVPVHMIEGQAVAH